MQIAGFRVYKYRNIQDSGYIPIENLTCIVGKNQSGKTSLLKALHKFNPHEKEPYNLRREWPRGERVTRDRKQVVCEVSFILDTQEREELAKLTSVKMETDAVLITKDYEGNFEVQFPDQPDLFPDKLHPNEIDSLCSALPKLAEPVGEKFANIANKFTEDTKRLAKEGRFSDLASIAQHHEEELRSSMTEGNPAPQHQNENTFISSYVQKLNEIQTNLEEAPTMQSQAHDYIVSKIPTFIYMSDYMEFEGKALLNQVQERRDSNQTTREDDTFLMILKLAGLDLDKLIKQGASSNPNVKHDRQLDLQDGALTLTKDVAGRWGQNPYNVEFRVDDQNFFTDIEETGKDIGMIPLDEQSKGFRWFFSFDLHFSYESEGKFEGCVLLLDEPGLHLHPGGQQDLLERLDEYAEKNTLIYTTHLPFLIDLREPSRIRIISEKDSGAEVNDDLGASGPDEKLTLQAALGMRANQSYLVAQQNLVVEGVDDFIIITELSNLFERSNLKGLPEDVLVTAGGGASEAVYIATFMVGQSLEVVALFDSDNEGRQNEERLRTKWLTRYKDIKSNSILLGTAIGKKNEVDFAIEDLFPEDYYLEKVNESHEKKMKDANFTDLSLSEGGLLCNRVERAFEGSGIHFNKGSVAKIIKKEMVKMNNVKELPEGTKEKAEKLFKKLRALFKK